METDLDRTDERPSVQRDETGHHPCNVAEKRRRREIGGR
jgi:hypothetical protein